MKAKNIHLSEDCIKFFSIKAIENGSNFKNYVQDLLEEIAKTKSLPKIEKKKKS